MFQNGIELYGDSDFTHKIQSYFYIIDLSEWIAWASGADKLGAFVMTISSTVFKINIYIFRINGPSIRRKYF